MSACKISPAKMIQLSEYLQVTGTVQPVDSRVSQVRSSARGRLQDVLAKVGRPGTARARNWPASTTWKQVN